MYKWWPGEGWFKWQGKTRGKWKKSPHFYNATNTHLWLNSIGMHKRNKKVAKKLKILWWVTSGKSCIVSWWAKQEVCEKISLILTLQQSHTHIQFNRNAWKKWGGWNFFENTMNDVRRTSIMMGSCLQDIRNKKVHKKGKGYDESEDTSVESLPKMTWDVESVEV